MSEGEVVKTRTLEEVKNLVLTSKSGFDSEHLLREAEKEICKIKGQKAMSPPTSLGKVVKISS